MRRMADEAVERPRSAELFTPILPVLALLAVMWGEEAVDTALNGRLDRFGIRPRALDGLDGILFAPFLHGGFGHLIANTFPFLLMGGAICLGSVRRFVQVTVIVGLIGGVGTWLTGPEHSVHTGASGLVFGYLTLPDQPRPVRSQGQLHPGRCRHLPDLRRRPLGAAAPSGREEDDLAV